MKNDKRTAKEEKEKKLDETVFLWKTTPKDGNESLLEQYRADIWIKVFELYDNKRLKSDTVYYDPNTLLNTLVEALDRYDLERGPFSHYFAFLLERRSIDAYRKAKTHDPSVDPASLRFEAPVSAQNADSKLTLGDTLADVNAEEQAARDEKLDSLFAEMTALVLNFAKKSGRKNNPNRQMWQQIFYTEDMTLIMKKYLPNFLHERDIFRAMNLEYLDYYMEAACRTGTEVMHTPLKPYGQVVPGRSGTTPLPLPADVSLAYLKGCQGISVGASARSTQLKFYKEDKAEIYSKANSSEI